MTVSSPSRPKRARLWCALTLGLMVNLAADAEPSGAVAATSQGAAIAAGERIYVEGVLPSGLSLRGVRQDQGEAEGSAAACMNCHRRSGLGTIEGVSLVPPITVKYLRRSTATNTNDLEMAHVEGYPQHSVPYTDATLALALRGGVASDGRTLSVLMPRYDLDETAMQDL